jgi:hypothetical protein
VPALPPYIIEPIFEQFLALLPDRVVHHPLGRHKPCIPDRVILEKLVQILVFGCAYRRIAEEGCSAPAIRDRRDEWIELGMMEALRQIALSAYDRFIGLELEDVAVDCCITKAPCGEDRARARWIGGKVASNARWRSMPRASRSDPSAPRPVVTTPAPARDPGCRVGDVRHAGRAG